MQHKPPYFEHHIFFCTNHRENGEQSCANYDAQNMRDYAKQICKNKGLNHVRVNQAGCLGRCEHGPVAVVYPEGVWYQLVDTSDIDEIVSSHLENGNIVSRLEIQE
jgi:(2Fe-2S) ferredoxin